jgi:hypothetical protein
MIDVEIFAPPKPPSRLSASCKPFSDLAQLVGWILETMVPSPGFIFLVGPSSRNMLSSV